MSRTKALYTLIGLSNKAKNLQDYKLSNLTFGLAVVFLEEFEIKYENAGDPLSAYYDVVTLHLNGRYLSIPAPLLSKDTLAECLKKGKVVELLEHNRQYRQFKNLDERKKSYDIISSRYLKIVREYFDINIVSTALWALDMPKEFEEWCFEFLCQSSEPNEEIVSLVN